MNELRILSGLAEIAEGYETFLLDSWGVLQNGVHVLDGVNDCLQTLKTRAKQLVILSNSARRSTVVAKELEAAGIDMDCISHVITGGEAAWQALNAREDRAHQALGYRCYYLGSKRSSSLMDGLDLDCVASADEASFILCTSPPDEGLNDNLQNIFEQAITNGLTMVCANPDLVAYHGKQRRFCAGEVARQYEKCGGTVVYHGKPHPAFYRLALEDIGFPDPEQVLTVGDSFATDLAGAKQAGVDALFVMSGIHRGKLSNPATQIRELEQLCQEKNLWPKAAVDHFRWAE